jgi:SAM-dependent methyltransferase
MIVITVVCLLLTSFPSAVSQYNEAFYQDHVHLKPAYEVLANLISHIVDNNDNTEGTPNTDISIKTYVDVGCGHGFLVAALRHSPGFQNTVFCIEGSRAAVQFWPDKYRKIYYTLVDLETASMSVFPTQNIDAVISFEVAEHIRPQHAEHFVKLLVARQPQWIFFTAATPGQGGRDHFNEQPLSYWIDIFNRYDYQFDFPVTLKMRNDIIDQHVKFAYAPWYSKNMLVFRKQPNLLQESTELESYAGERYLSSILPYGCQRRSGSCSPWYDLRDRAEFHMLRSKAILSMLQDKATSHMIQQQHLVQNKSRIRCSKCLLKTWRIKITMNSQIEKRTLILRGVEKSSQSLAQIKKRIQQWRGGEISRDFYLLAHGKEIGDTFLIKENWQLASAALIDAEECCITRINLQVLR